MWRETSAVGADTDIRAYGAPRDADRFGSENIMGPTFQSGGHVAIESCDLEDCDISIHSDEGFYDENYPTDTALAVVRLWPACNYSNLFKFIESIWTYGDWGWHGPVVDVYAADPSHNEFLRYRISTGGWSGNEDIMRAMKDNYLFWTLHWCLSKRGGHYEFLPAQM